MGYSYPDFEYDTTRKNLYTYVGSAEDFDYSMKDYYGDVVAFDYYFTQAEDGSYRLTYGGISDQSLAPIGFKGATDLEGNEVSYLATRGQALVTDSDGTQIRVWCVEPLVSTFTGNAYESREAKENLQAALITLFGDDSTELGRAIMQAMIWETVGYENTSLSPVKLAPSYKDGVDYTEVELTEEEMAEYLNMKDHITEATNYYVSGATVGFTSETEGVSISDGRIVLTRGKIPETIILKANDEALLSYYANGQMIFPDGITGEVDTEAGTLILTIDTSKIADAGEIRMSMIPDGFAKETIEYYSNYDRQTLMAFGINDPLFETVQFEIIEEPEEPGEDTPKEEEPEDPDKETPKEEEPEEPDKETPKEEAPVVSQTAVKAPKTGDGTPVALYCVILGASAVLFVYRKRWQK